MVVHRYPAKMNQRTAAMGSDERDIEIYSLSAGFYKETVFTS